MSPSMKVTKPLDDAGGVDLSQAGSEYLRALWRRREAARQAPFTVSEEALLGPADGVDLARGGSAADAHRM